MTALNRTAFVWSPNKERAAQLVADDHFTDEEIVEKVGCGRRTLYDWKERPEFVERVLGLRRKMTARLERYALQSKRRRLRHLQEQHDKLCQVIVERAAKYQGEAGGLDTGVMVRTVKAIGRGETFERIEEDAVDAALLRELRETSKQIAQECGQLGNGSVNVSVNVSNTLHAVNVERLVALPYDELLRLHREALGLSEVAKG